MIFQIVYHPSAFQITISNSNLRDVQLSNTEGSDTDPSAGGSSAASLRFEKVAHGVNFEKDRVCPTFYMKADSTRSGCRVSQFHKYRTEVSLSAFSGTAGVRCDPLPTGRQPLYVKGGTHPKDQTENQAAIPVTDFPNLPPRMFRGFRVFRGQN